MPTSFAQPGASLDEHFATAALETTETDTTLYRTLFAHAAAMGVLADILLHNSLMGVGLPIWIALLALDVIALTWRAERWMEREAGAWLMVALLCALGIAWRNSGPLQVLNIAGIAGSLCMAAIAMSEQRAAVFATRIRDTTWAAFRVVRTVAAGIIPIAFHAGRATRERTSWEGARMRNAARAATFATVLLVVFGSLLRGADPVFASIFNVPDFDFGETMSHVVLTGFFTWIVGGWARSALLTRTEDLSRAPDTWPVSLSTLDITAALGTLNVLFAAYVVTQLGWFFGGEQFLQARTGLTAAAYARSGFFEMMWVVVLVVPLLVATRSLLKPGIAIARRHTLLSLPIIALLGAMIFSAFTRMQLYVTYFGLTVDRLMPMIFMTWLGVVLVWLAATVLRGHPRYFFTGAILSGMATLGVLNVTSPDTAVARVNIARAATLRGGARSELDLAYLASLSGEAVPLAVSATLAAGPTSDPQQRCDAASGLLDRWGPTSRNAGHTRREVSWREWNAGNANGVRAVRVHAAELRNIMHETCVPLRKAAALRRAEAAR